MAVLVAPAVTVSQPTARVRGFRAYATKAHDGDSFWVMCDTGFGGRAEPELRLIDVYAPELLQMRFPAAGQPGSAQAKAFVAEWLRDAATRAGESRWSLWVETYLTRSADPKEKQSFTRYLATVWCAADCLIWGQAGPVHRSLNYDVAGFLARHPDWPPGD